MLTPEGFAEDLTEPMLPRDMAELIRARDEEIRNSEWENGFAAGLHDVLRSLSYEWGNTFNDYRTNENIVIYTSPSRQSAIERAEGSSELIAVQQRVSEWETIKPEDEDE